MSEPLIHNFERFEDAEAARRQLLAEGLAPAAVRLHVIDDEAGPAEGNFVSGNGRRDETTAPTATQTGGAVPYERNFAHTIARGVHLLMVDAADPAQRDRARAVLARYDARDLADLTPPQDRQPG